MKLNLQINSEALVEVAPMPGVFITPAITEDYWLFRVAVSEKQAVIGFPKFTLIGIGFQIEDDWNTNLPSNCEAAEIYGHIKHNANAAGDVPQKEDCLAAIQLIKDAVARMTQKKPT